MGGYVAYEIACHLEASGDLNSLVFLLDTYPPEYVNRDEQASSQELLKRELHALEEASAGRVSQVDKQSRGKHLIAWGESILTLLSPRYLDIMEQVTMHHVRLLRHYTPRRYAGSLSLFVASLDINLPPPEIWSPYIDGEIRVYQIATHHGIMTRPDPMAAIGKIVAKALAEQDWHMAT